MSLSIKMYFDLLDNLINFSFLFAFVKNNMNITVNKKRIAFLLFLQLVYSIWQSIPFNFVVGIALDAICVSMLCFPNLKKVPLLVLKYELLFYLLFAINVFLHTFLMQDSKLALSNDYYMHCKGLIAISLCYVFYMIYTYTRQMKHLHLYSRRHYHYYFNGIFVVLLLTLSYLSLFFIRSEGSDPSTIPLFFTVIFALIAACMFLYQKFFDLMEENAQSLIQLEKYHLSQQYALQIEENLETLRSLRHDMKNHLLIVDGFAERQDYQSIHQYISSITDSLSDTVLFDCPSDTVSALINAKYQLAHTMGVDCQITLDLPHVHVDDFSMVTILGNLFDNALTASSKCAQGQIFLSILQLDTYLQLIIRNNHQEQIQEENGIFISTKPEKDIFHGIGIKNVRSAVSKLDGQMDISYTEREFLVEVLVPNY